MASIWLRKFRSLIFCHYKNVSTRKGGKNEASSSAPNSIIYEKCYINESLSISHIMKKEQGIISALCAILIRLKLYGRAADFPD